MSTPTTPRRAPTKFDRNYRRDRPEYAENTILAHIDEGAMTSEDGRLIRIFVAELKATKGISFARANKIVSHLCGWRHYLGPFTTNRIPDINAGVAALREDKPVNGKPFKPNTQRDYITILRQFYLWLIENEYSTVQPGRIRKIQKPPQARMTKTASELLQPDEVARMIAACKSNRDRAMVSMIYEGALRTEETSPTSSGFPTTSEVPGASSSFPLAPPPF
jgi:site-specific recombinase XerD